MVKKVGRRLGAVGVATQVAHVENLALDPEPPQEAAQLLRGMSLAASRQTHHNQRNLQAVSARKGLGN